MATLTGATIANTYKTLMKGGTSNPVALASDNSDSERVVFGEDDGADVRTSLYLTRDRVGIGTATPSCETTGNSLLHIADTGGSNPAILNLSGGSGGNASASGVIAFTDPGVLTERIAQIVGEVDGTDADTVGGKLDFYTQLDNGALTHRMIIKNDGKVGIGTATPDALLTVDGNAASNATVTLAKFHSHEDNGEGSILELTGTTHSTTGSRNITLQSYYGTNTVSNLALNPSGGNVGIGTAAPEHALDVRITEDTIYSAANSLAAGGGALIQVENEDDGACFAGLRFRAATGDGFIGGVTDGNSNNLDLVFVTDTSGTTGGEHMRILQEGNVGIGTTTPGDKLHVYATSATISAKVQSNSLADTEEAYWIAAGRRADGSHRYAKIGVGDNDSSATNESVGFVAISAGNGNLGYIYFDDADQLRVSGTYAHLGTTSGTAATGADYSDERLKDISDDPFPYGLDTVNSLTPIKYKWKKIPELGNRFGFGAQTIQSIIPELISESGFCIDGYDIDESDGAEGATTPKSNDNKLVMEYSQLHAILVKAIQELSAKVTALENA